MGKALTWPFEDHYKCSIGNERHLFVDDALVQRTRNVAKRLHQPVKHPANPVIRGDLPYENDYAVLHGTVLREPDGRFRAWYLSGTGALAYAESEDGLAWRKPLLDRYRIDGSDTNVVYWTQHPELARRDEWKFGGGSIMSDPGAPPAERYRMFTFEVPLSDAARERFRTGYGYYAISSPDGIRWPTEQSPVLTRRDDDPHMSDANACMYDPLRRRFIAFTKRHQVRPDAVGDQGVMSRVRGISFSDDFRAWTPPVNCLLPDDRDPRDVQFYRQGGWTHQGMYLGLLEIYHSDPDNPTQPLMRDLQLISSRDGELWWRAGGRRTFIPCGPVGSWDGQMLDLNAGGPIDVGDEHWIYYGGRAYPHEINDELFPWDGPRGAGIGVATLRRDRYVSYDAGPETGEVVTRLLRFERGTSLHVNARTGPDGFLRCEVLDSIERHGIPRRQLFWDWGIGAPLAGFGAEACRPVTGDHLDAGIRWRGGRSIGELAGRWVALRFVMRDCSLFAFQIR